jgi:integrase
VKPPRVSAPGEEIKPLDSEECAAFLRASQGERLEALYILAIHCGLREGELLTLRWEDVDLDATKPALLVRRTLTRGEDGRGWVVGISTKSGKGRRVRLTQRAVGTLRDHRKRQLEERMRLAGIWRDQGLVFPNETGSPLNPSNLRNRSFKRIKARSGVREDLRFHDLRHTCATLLLSEGVNVKVVSEQLGHVRAARTRVNNHYPEYLLPHPAGHAGLRSRCNGGGIGIHVVSRGTPPGLQHGCSKRAAILSPALFPHLQIPLFAGSL